MAQIMSMKINTRNSEEPTLALLLKRHKRKVVRTVYNTVLCAEHTRNPPLLQKEKTPYMVSFLVGGGGFV